MNLLFVCVCALLWTVSCYSQSSQVLVTPSFVVTIIDPNEEGVVSADNITYVGVNRKSGDTIKIQGRTLHTVSADGTPGRFIGYLFKNKNVSYLVAFEGELTVTSGDKTVLKESGEWAGR
jgi:L-ascorbate metabolism protein UlaG (beta-lactamase superfamily)